MYSRSAALGAAAGGAASGTSFGARSLAFARASAGAAELEATAVVTGGASESEGPGLNPSSVVSMAARYDPSFGTRSARTYLPGGICRSRIVEPFPHTELQWIASVR